MLSITVQFSHSLMNDPWIAVLQASLSITNSQSLPKFMFIESVMSSNHFILCHPLFLLPSIFPIKRVFSNEWLFTADGQSIGASVLVLPMNIQDWFPLGLTGLILTVQESSPTSQFKSISSSMLSFLPSTTLESIHHYRENHSLE